MIAIVITALATANVTSIITALTAHYTALLNRRGTAITVAEAVAIGGDLHTAMAIFVSARLLEETCNRAGRKVVMGDRDFKIKTDGSQWVVGSTRVQNVAAAVEVAIDRANPMVVAGWVETFMKHAPMAMVGERVV